MKRFARPKPDETEEDLIKQNEDFVREQKLDSKKKATEDKAEAKDELNNRPTVDDILKQYNVNSADDNDDDDLVLVKEDPLVLSLQIKERINPGVGLQNSIPKPEAPDTKRKLSHFAKSRQKARDQQTSSNIDVFPSSSSVEMMDYSNTPEHPKAVPIGDQIHPLLAGMTEAEILEEQKKLIEKMDPMLVEFVRNRKKQALSKPVEYEAPKVLQPMSDLDNAKVPPLKLEDLPINPEAVKTIPHMDKIEPEKLKWTLPTPELSNNSVRERDARFGFDGHIITEAQEVDSRTWLKGLHHHGAEAERPGYTLDELLTLARSINISQRNIAFDTFAAIFRNAHDGLFDMVLSKSIFSLCLEMDIMYVIRKGIDNTDSLTISAALNCLAGLLFSEREEASLDTILLWTNSDAGPWIQIEKEDEVDDSEKIQQENEEKIIDEDQKIVSVDLIEFLIQRACLLERFSCLLYYKKEQLTAPGIISILQMLIRIARHTPDSILNEKTILQYFITNHLRLNTKLFPGNGSQQSQNLAGLPLPLVFKLLRVLITSSKENANNILSQYESLILSSIQENLTCNNEQLINVPQIELLIQQCSLLWKTLIELGVGIEAYFSFSPVIVNFFHLYLRKDLLNTFDLNHSALMISLLADILKKVEVAAALSTTQFRQYSDLIAPFTIKTCIILGSTHLKDQVDVDASLAAIQQGIELFVIAKTKFNFEQPVGVTEALEQFWRTQTCQKLTKNLERLSLFLKKQSTNIRERYPNNLLFTEAVLFGGRLNPILRQGTPFIFIKSFLRYTKTTKINTNKTDKVLNQHILNYLHKLVSAPSLCNENNYYLKYELHCIDEILDTLTVTEHQDYLQVQVQLWYKLCSLVQIGNEELCKRFLTRFVNSWSSQMSPEELSDICKFYCQLVDVENKQNQSLRFQHWKQKLMVPEWLTQPLQAVYSSIQTHMNTKGENSKLAISNFRILVFKVLKFIELCLTSSAVAGVGISLVNTKSEFVITFTRICQCFLMTPDIFLCKPIRDVLGSLFSYFLNHKILANSGSGPVFTAVDKTNEEILGTPFESFYSQLIAEYISCSYADEIFTSYILLPLRVTESSRIKLRFSIDIGVRFVRLQRENGLIPLSYFIGTETHPAPIETDQRVLQAYNSAIKSGRCTPERNPFLYEILKFHLQSK